MSRVSFLKWCLNPDLANRLFTSASDMNCALIIMIVSLGSWVLKCLGPLSPPKLSSAWKNNCSIWSRMYALDLASRLLNLLKRLSQFKVSSQSNGSADFRFRWMFHKFCYATNAFEQSDFYRVFLRVLAFLTLQASWFPVAFIVFWFSDFGSTSFELLPDVFSISVSHSTEVSRSKRFHAIVFESVIFFLFVFGGTRALVNRFVFSQSFDVVDLEIMRLQPFEIREFSWWKSITTRVRWNLFNLFQVPSIRSVHVFKFFLGIFWSDPNFSPIFFQQFALICLFL